MTPQIAVLTRVCRQVRISTELPDFVVDGEPRSGIGCLKSGRLDSIPRLALSSESIHWQQDAEGIVLERGTELLEQMVDLVVAADLRLFGSRTHPPHRDVDLRRDSWTSVLQGRRDTVDVR